MHRGSRQSQWPTGVIIGDLINLRGMVFSVLFFYQNIIDSMCVNQELHKIRLPLSFSQNFIQPREMQLKLVLVE